MRSTFANVEGKQATNLSFADVPGLTSTTGMGTGATESNTAVRTHAFTASLSESNVSLQSAPSGKNLRPLVFSAVSAGTVESPTRSRGASENEKETGDGV